jgi:hypothetical protein
MKYAVEKNLVAIPMFGNPEIVDYILGRKLLTSVASTPDYSVRMRRNWHLL